MPQATRRRRWSRSLLMVPLLVCSTEVEGQRPASRHTSARVEALLRQMTLEEKVGQMTQVTLQTVAADSGHPAHAVLLDSAKLHRAIVERGVGSILNVLDVAFSEAEWHRIVAEMQRIATTRTRLGIPLVYGIDAVHGMNYARGATIFPHNLALAATFDRSLVRRTGVATGAEILALGLPWNFSPVLDVGRQPLWPRFYETFGEDARVGAELGREMVLGLQSSGRVAATLKHYLAYGIPRTGRDRTPTVVTEREIREHVLPQFREAVGAGAHSVMVNSGEIDGEPVHASRYWLTDVLRGELGFDGVIVTDWEDIHYLHTRHRVAESIREAVRMAVEAGIDMSMTPYEYAFADHLVALVRDGTIPEQRIDASVRRILRMKASLGLFEDPVPTTAPGAAAELGAPATRALSREAARASVTLLRNANATLPLRRDVRVLVTGPAATSVSALHGGWSYTWQGADPRAYPPGIVTLLDAVRERVPGARHVPGAEFTAAGDLAAARAAAEDSDVIIVALGEAGYAEFVGDIDDLTMPKPQLDLARAMLATGKPVVLVLLQGRPRILQEVGDSADAVVMGYWPGPEGGTALAEVLFGETNPGGRLPFTYPRHPNALLTYDHKQTETYGPGFDRAPTGYSPQFAFGEGLSYTTFAYGDLRLSEGTIRPGGRVTATVTVTNTGTRAGTHAVLLFIRQHYARVTPAVRKLRDFERISLEPGASRTVTFSIPSEALTYVGHDGNPVYEPGRFDVIVQGLTAPLVLLTP